MAPACFMFRRDLRLEDNTGLIKALETGEEVLPCFVFDPMQAEKNPYRSDASVQFMIESLRALQQQLKKKSGKLFLFHGKPEQIVSRLIDSEGIRSVHINRDYTPYSKERDGKIKAVCMKKKTCFNAYGDCLLNEPEAVKKNDGKPYTVYTAFYKKASEHKVRKPERNSKKDFYREKIGFEVNDDVYERILPERNKKIAVSGGRKNALRILKGLEAYRDYKKERDHPALDATTHLSAHLKYGTLSVREVYHRIREVLGSSHPLIRQLYWRDFFTHIAFHFPKVFGESFHERFDEIRWSKNKEDFRRWCQGKTGFPIVDAGMRELNETGYMHNRARMITSSFLTKDLHIDWRMGEKYFAEKLVDYDPAVNNGNWQWSASTGCDAQPYFRIFNPWLQQKKYDADCGYIKKWVPELKDAEAKTIHRLYEERIRGYPEPMVDHRKEAALAKNYFKAAMRWKR